jgi:cullin 1
MSQSPKVIGLEEGWQNEIKTKAIDVLEEILNTGVDKTKHTFPPGTFMPIYTTCYNMCTQRQPYNWSEQLYQRHGETIKNYLSSTVLPALKDKHDEYLLKELNHRWSNHKIMNKWMTRFFMYLDRYYVKHHSLPTLADAGLKYFKTLVFDIVKKDACNAMLALVNRERDGEIIDRDLLKSCCEVFEAMGLGTLDAYTQDFEDFLLMNSEEYYARKSQVWIQSDSTPSYMIKAEQALTEESQRVQNYLNKETEPKLLRVCETDLLEKHERELLDKEGSGCKFLLQNDKSEDLSRMFRLFQRVPEGLPPIATLVKGHIETMGHEVVNNREAEIQNEPKKESTSDPSFVKALLALHDKYRGVVNNEFAGNALFQKALKEAFVEFINRGVGKFSSAEYMSTFCDRILKTGGEKMSDAQVEEYLEKVVQIFSYLTDKDLFAEIYRNQLSKRLLNQRSASDDAERLMIQKLKLQCGAQFTGKMEGMLNDLAIGADHQGDFEKHIKATAADTSMESFSVQVLTTGYWPTYKTMEVNLPPSMVKCTQLFKDYYDKKTSHRRLQVCVSLK